MSKQTFINAIFSTAFLAASITSSFAQNAGGPAVGQWKSYLPYSEVNGICTDGSVFYCATKSGFFTYDRADGTLSGYSKETGMHDIGLTAIGYDPLTTKTVLAYENSNIDIFKDGGFVNIPALKLSQESGNKTVNNITASDGIAYLSTGIGLILLNLNKDEIKETVAFYDSSLTASVYASVLDQTYLYAATSIGLFRINKDNAFIQNYLSWEKLDNKSYRYLTNSNNHVYAAVADSLFEVPASGTVNFKEKTSFRITHLDPEYNGSGVWIAAADTTANNGYCVLRKEDGSIADSFYTVYPSQVMQLGNGDIWFGDQSDYRFPNVHGLRKKTSSNTSEAFFPSGPITNGSLDVSAYNGSFWVAHSGKTENWGVRYNTSNFSQYSEGTWTNMSWITDNWKFASFIRILNDQKSGKLYAASYYAGLYERDAQGAVKTYTGNDHFSEFSPPSDLYLASGLALDDQNNLWMTNYGGANELVVKTNDDKWYKMKSIDGNPGHTATDVLVDDYGYKWFLGVGNNGAIVYNDNGTISNTSDDSYRIFKAGTGAGGLPDNNTLSIIKDKEGAIWVGTTNGIGIISCSGEDIFNRSCEAYLKPYQDDQFAGYLFQGQSIKAMAVDGANRKWIGTASGVWLLSADAETIIFKFTEDNSPLLSNNIEHINIDPINGDVYISTSKGLIAYRSTATEGSTEEDEKLFVYPNPVPSNYNGMVAIRGMAENSDVRITDISGQLIYRTKANGGEAVWNGMDYTGHKAQSGVYLVFAVSKDGTKKATAKFILHR